MAAIRTIAVALTARTRKFEQSMKRAQTITQKFTAGIAASATRIARWGTVLSAVAIGGLSIIVKKQLKLIDTLAKTSRALKVSTEDLQALHLAGGLAGIGTEVVDKALKRLIKSASDAGHGLSTAVRALEALGLEADALEGMAPDEMFRLIADRVKELGVNTTTTGAVMDLFGARIGADLIPLLEQGSGAFDQIAKDVEAMGLSLSNVDAAKVEAANDAWLKFQGILSGVAQKLTVELAPFITAAVEAMVEWGSQGGKAGDTITTALELVAKGVGFVADIVQGVRAAWIGWQTIVAKVSNFILQAVGNVGKAVAGLIDAIPFVEVEFSKTFEGVLIASQATADAMGKQWSTTFDDLASDPWSDRIMEKFDEIRKAAQLRAEESAKAAEKAAEDAAAAADKALRDIEKPAAAIAAAAAGETLGGPGAQREGAFAQADLRRVAIGGVSAASRDTNADRTLSIMEALDEKIATILQQQREPIVLRAQ